MSNLTPQAKPNLLVNLFNYPVGENKQRSDCSDPSNSKASLSSQILTFPKKNQIKHVPILTDNRVHHEKALKKEDVGNAILNPPMFPKEDFCEVLGLSDSPLDVRKSAWTSFLRSSLRPVAPIIKPIPIRQRQI